MITHTFSLREDYWETFKLEEEDIEFLHNLLLELETPLTSEDLVKALVSDRIRREKLLLEQQRTAGGDLFYPKDIYSKDQNLIFPGMEWQRGKVIGIRPGYNPDIGAFQVINVAFDVGDEREFASGLANHRLNEPPEITEETDTLTEEKVQADYSSQIIEILEDYLQNDTDFVRIAWRWFPRALLVDINVGHLNLAEAVLDMVDGGPLPTIKLLEQIELSADVNPKLVEFSLDLALQEDSRFDEVGPAGDILWFLQRLEPQEVQTPPIYLRYGGIDYDRLILTEDMLALERELDDELSPLEKRSHLLEEEEICLIFPHWISGTLPLSSRIQHLFPTAYEAPRIQFVLVDGNTGDRYPAWVVRETRYVYGLKDWYDSLGMIPGSVFRIRKGTKPGEVIIQTKKRRSSREWIRTVLIGSDGGVVFAMLKHIISAPFDDRMAISIPDQEALSQIWQNIKKEKPPFERVVVNMVKELAKLNPQSHVHISELYAAINIVLRCPPGPILALLASRPWFTHVGDLHYRLNDSVDI
jgi:hypothetical protein